MFRHALLGEAVQDELLASEQRRLHAAYAAALAARPTPDGAAGASHLAALAHHAAAANVGARARGLDRCPRERALRLLAFTSQREPMSVPWRSGIRPRSPTARPARI